jgi:hypothetical protein
VLARAAALTDDEDFFYVFGDVRRFPGYFNQSEFAADPASLLYQGVAGAGDNWDMRGCTPLLNALEMRGAVCLVSTFLCRPR